MEAIRWIVKMVDPLDGQERKMNDASPVPGIGNMRRLIRMFLIGNFILLFALIGPGNNRQLYLAEKRLGIAHIITYTLQFWFIASTVLVSVIFIRSLLSKSEISRPQRLTKLDWALFVSWLFVLTILCLFAFMMGMGG